jgi:hypothetical protein
MTRAELLTRLAVSHDLWFAADEAHAKARGKARQILAKAMDRIEEREHRLVQKFLALPIVSLADAQGLLLFMGRECQELVPCPANDRRDYLTRSFDLLVVGMDRIAGGPAAAR